MRKLGSLRNALACTEGEIVSRQNGVMKWTPLKSGISFEMKTLPPGDYHVARIRELDVVTRKDSADAKRARKILYVCPPDIRRIENLHSLHTTILDA
jgi:hypothetical protein